jgi:hypothetical protein
LYCGGTAENNWDQEFQVSVVGMETAMKVNVFFANVHVLVVDQPNQNFNIFPTQLSHPIP